MTTAITLAGPDHAAQLSQLMERRAVETGAPDWDEAERGRQGRAVAPLLAGGPEGAVWLVGPVRAPLGHVIVAFGWSLALAGREAWVEDVFIRASVRRRGIATEVLHAVAVSLRQGGIRALQARVAPSDAAGSAFCAHAGFRPDARRLLSDPL